MDALARLPSRPVGRAGRPPARCAGSAGGGRRGAAMNRFAHRLRPLWIAALVHRLSGLALAIFLPLHFLALGLAIGGGARLDGFLRWTDQPAVKISEALLVFLLTVHLLGGLRILVIENFDWRDGQKQLATLAATVSALVAFFFLVRVF